MLHHSKFPPILKDMLNIPKEKLASLIRNFRQKYPEEFEVLKYIADKWKGEVILRGVQHGKSSIFMIISPKRKEKIIYWAVDASGDIQLGNGAKKTKEELCKLLDPDPIEDEMF
jgi:hypothetical protein